MTLEDDQGRRDLSLKSRRFVSAFYEHYFQNCHYMRGVVNSVQFEEPHEISIAKVHQ